MIARYFKSVSALMLLAVLGVSYGSASYADIVDISSQSLIKREVQIDLKPHRALYDITLNSAKTASGIADIHGQMFYDIVERCDAWETTHRFVMTYDYIDSPSSQVVSEFKTFETKKGDYFKFSVERIRDGLVQELIEGETDQPLLLADDQFRVKFTSPQTQSLQIDKKTVFPIHHTINILNQAAAGDRFIKAQVFDGSDTEGPFKVSGIILKPVSEPERKRIWPKDVETSLVRAPGWRMQMAIFPLSQAQESAEAEYEIDMNLLINGVITDLDVKYPEFSIDQSLKALSLYERPVCDVNEQAETQEVQ